MIKITTGHKEPVDQARIRMRPQRRRRGILFLSFLFFVVAPICIGSWFWMQLASDRFVSGAGFSVRSMEQGSGSDMLGGLTGMPGAGSTSSESYIAMEFIKSRAMVEIIEAEKSFEDLFRGEQIDPLFRMSDARGMEDRIEYWRRRVSTSFDSSSGIVTFDVEAFSARDAHMISGIVLAEVGVMVNRLSEAARDQALANADKEVLRAEARMRQAMLDLRRFRDTNGDIDPNATAAARLNVDTQFDAELLDVRARISALQKQVDADSPPLLALRRREAALVETAGISVERRVVSSAQIEQFEALQIEKQFAQQSYATALASLEAARVQADGQQRYLAVFASPALADVAVRPDRPLNIAMLVICALCFWGVGTLVTYSVRDHMS